MKPIMILAIIAMMYMALQYGAKPEAVAEMRQIDSQACAESYRQAYSAEWAEMNTVQRLAVGLQASGECAP